jgi:hypothetical protein
MEEEKDQQPPWKKNKVAEAIPTSRSPAASPPPSPQRNKPPPKTVIVHPIAKAMPRSNVADVEWAHSIEEVHKILSQQLSAVW